MSKQQVVGREVSLPRFATLALGVLAAFSWQNFGHLPDRAKFAKSGVRGGRVRFEFLAAVLRT